MIMEKSLFDFVSAISGCKFAHIVYTSDCKFPKKSGLGNVTKIVTTNVQLNYDYEKAVNNRLEKEGKPRDFKSDKLTWGVWEVHNKVIAHNGKRYLRYYSMKNANSSTVYYVDGVLATSEQVANIEAYIASKNTKSAKQSAHGLDDNQVLPKAVEFDNIITLTVCGETYTTNPTKQVA